MVDIANLINFRFQEPMRPYAMEIINALNWIISQPEGEKILQKAYELHNKPLTIYVNTQSSLNGYANDNERHAIWVNPPVIKNLKFKGEKGETIAFTWERFFSHEFVHATQPEIQTKSMRYHAALQSIKAPIFAPFKNMLDQEIQKKTAGITDNTELSKIYISIYDNFIAPFDERANAQINKIAAQNSIVRDYIETCEQPAIKFEAQIMQRKGEAGRSFDYLEDPIVSEPERLLIRNLGIERIKAIHKKLPISARTIIPNSGDKIPQFSKLNVPRRILKTVTPVEPVIEIPVVKLSRHAQGSLERIVLEFSADSWKSEENLNKILADKLDPTISLGGMRAYIADEIATAKERLSGYDGAMRKNEEKRILGFQKMDIFLQRKAVQQQKS